MKRAVGATLILIFAYSLWRLAIWYLGAIYVVSLGFFLTAISIVFVAVLSKAYKNWPTDI